MADVAIVGAGVIGLACARELARNGASVVLLEAAAAPGLGSSARANGGVRAQFTTAPNIAFSLFSIAAFEDMVARGAEIGLHQTGYLLIAGTETAERGLRAGFELQRSLGVDVEWLDPDATAVRAPMVRRDGVRAATFHARDGFLDPAGVCVALARDAAAAGSIVRTKAPVHAIERDGSGLVARHAGGTVRADAVVNAAGADARAVARSAGADVPVEPVRRNLAHVLDPAGGEGLTPMLADLDTGVLARREPAGGWVVAYSNPDDAPGRDTRVDPRFLEDLAVRLPNRFPFLLDLPIDPARCWAGLYPETPDHHAIVGADPNMPGLFHAVGFGGHGVMHAPAAGRAIAELVLHGACATFDLHPLRPERFAEGDLVVESAVF